MSVGENMATIRTDEGAYTAVGAPGARLATLESGHEIPLEQPRQTAALIEAFPAELR